MAQDGSVIPIKFISQKDEHTMIKEEIHINSKSQVASPRKYIVTKSRSQESSIDLIQSNTNDLGIKITNVRSLSTDLHLEEACLVSILKL